MGEKNFDWNFVRNFSTSKLSANTVNPLNNAPGVYLIIEILEIPYWKGLLKKTGVKKFGNCEKLIKFRNCV